MSNSSNQVTRAVRRALILGAVAASAGAPALAQDQTASSSGGTPALTEVVVTGSRIQSPNIAAASPITTVSAADIQATGLTRTADIINMMPMVFAAQNSTVTNGSDGTESINLRGLGQERTLTLVNGRRLGPGQGDGRNFSDINDIPAALIERIDIMTGGASSVYGADAVAGVVNFVLNTHFQGVKIDADYNFNQHHNGNAVASTVTAAGFPLPDSSVNTSFAKNVSVIMGSNFDENKGNATFYATYDKANATLESKYDYSSCSLGATKAGSLVCAGSGTSAKNGAGGYFQAYGVHNEGALFTNTVDGKTGAFRPFTGADSYNFGPLNFYQRPNERWTAGTFLSYDINSHLTAYGEAMFTRNTSSAQIAASGDFFTPTFIPCSNPQFTAEERATICSPANLAAQTPTGGPTPSGINMYIGRRNVEGGGRIATFANNSFRTVIGLKGDITDGWTFDAYAQRQTVDTNLGNQNYFDASRVANALNVVPGPGGVPTCASVIAGTDPNCVPWNIWVPNGVTQAALNYLQIPLLVQASTTEQVASGSVTGDLSRYGIKLPTAEDGLIVNVGAEWRSESADFLPDVASQLGNAEGSGGPTVPINGGFTVREAFTEVSLPLAQHLPLAESLAFNGGYRYSSYSEGFKTNTYKFALDWEPIHDIRARASYQRAVRAPNVNELFSPASVQLDGSTDPCAGTAPAATQAQCALAGVSAGQYGHIGANSAAQYNGFIGGNPDLKPETADTYSAGIILQPSMVPNLTMSLDYFDIEIKNVIGAIGADTIIQNCLATGSPTYCDAIHRDVNGSLFRTQQGFVSDTNVNFGKLSTRGLDVKAAYRTPIPAMGSLSSLGSLAFQLEGTRLISLQTEPLTDGPSYNCTGLFGVTCGAPNPAWRHVFTTTWSTPWDALDVTLRWRYLGSARSQLGSNDPQLSGVPLPLTEHIPAYNYLDLTARFAIYKGVSLQLGVNNIADKDPPIVSAGGGGFGSDCPTITPNGSSCNGNTFPGSYDSLGRFLFAHVTAQF